MSIVLRGLAGLQRIALQLLVVFWTLVSPLNLMGDRQRELELLGPDFRLQSAEVRFLDVRASALLEDGKPAKALADYVEALRLTEKAFGPRVRDVAHIKVLLASCALGMGDLTNALQYATDAKSLATTVCGDRHPLVAFAWNVIGLIKIE